MGNPIGDALASAKAAINKGNDLTKSVEGKTPSAYAPKPAESAANKTSAPAKSAAPKVPTISDELKAKYGPGGSTGAPQSKEITSPKYHTGGKIQKDGVQTIDAEKGETVLPNDDKDRAKELAVKHLEGMKDGMEKHAKKSEKKPAHKKHGKVKKMHVHVNDDNTFSMTHEHNPMEDGSPVADTTHSAPDMDGLIDHMQEHMGTPNPGEAEAEAGPAPAAPAAA